MESFSAVVLFLILPIGLIVTQIIHVWEMEHINKKK